MTGFDQLITPKPPKNVFSCGHPKTSENSYDIGIKVICLDCKRYAARKWYDTKRKVWA